MKLKDLVGWVGICLILLAYCLVSLRMMQPENIVYSLINLFGAAGIIISSYAKRDFQIVALNAVWLIVAVIGIIRSIS